MKLFFDTETTGLANFRAPADDPAQPRIVQLGAILVDERAHVAAEINLLVRPDGWTVPAEAAAVHGITTERCERFGLPAPIVVRLFATLVRRAELVVAHNLDFDRLLVRSEAARYGFTADLDLFTDVPGYCTMKAATHVCRLPHRNGRAGYKWPNLQETHRHFFGADFEDAHDAMADVRACARVYWELTGGKPGGAETAPNAQRPTLNAERSSAKPTEAAAAP